MSEVFFEPEHHEDDGCAEGQSDHITLGMIGAQAIAETKLIDEEARLKRETTPFESNI